MLKLYGNMADVVGFCIKGRLKSDPLPNFGMAQFKL
jgi:hypothetical protein